MSLFTSLLQKAYWRGVPFSVTAQAVRKGRKIAVHDYPFRDGGWVEDLGRSQQVYQFTGYLLGDFAPMLQRALDAACEIPGPGVLIHPSLGAVRVSLLSATSSVRKERMRVIEVSFEFMEQGSSLFPSIITATIGKVLSYVTDALPALATDLIGGAVTAAALGVVVLGEGSAVASSFAGACQVAAANPASLVSMAVGLPAPDATTTYGRYADASATTALPVGTTIASLQADLAAQRALVIVTSADAVTAASLFSVATASDVIGSLVAVTEVARATMTSPTDQVAAMVQLSTFTYGDNAGGIGLSGDIAAMRDALSAACRRAALLSLARAAAAYQPESYDDAAALRTTVAAVFDVEITAAGDAGEDASYIALKNLRAAIIEDLTARGASLPLVETVRLPSSLPSLVVSYRIYKDSSRSGQITARSRAVHPAFCPTTMQVLAA